MSTQPSASPRAGTSSTTVDDSLAAALSSRSRPSRPSGVTTSLTFGWRALLKIKHVPEQLFDVTITPVIFTLMFTYLFGGALAGSASDYLQFLLPGILVQTVIITTVYTGFTLNTDISKGVFDRFRSLPLWRPSPLVGALLGDAVRYAIASTVVVVLGLILGFRPDGGVVGVLGAVLILLVFASGIGWIFTTLGLVLRTPNAVMGVGMMIIMPVTFASNIFVDPSTMPSWLQSFVDVNPISHLVTAERGLMSGTASAGDIGWVLVATVALTAVFAPLTMYLYRRR
ncbi:ABC-2 type transport system permease protein [Haloactinopolyspora alba]|uniref:Transport permease protein n=1 Tax=Haloactinopolyspora alba TaxID=648780 RepID=A0A2P8DY90_9ACTN|nr:ABC transporter permease [Haloactinopolyspora alba]PSL02152.1 ABC-2 type transport system permease protein [Haloactinopolyspora alba]